MAVTLEDYNTDCFVKHMSYGKRVTDLDVKIALVQFTAWR